MVGFCLSRVSRRGLGEFRYLLRVLDKAGRSDVIFGMNSRTDVRGHGYQLAQGATALTE